MSVTQREHILAYPPLETTSAAKPEVADLTITKPLAIGGARGAQVVVCSIAKKAASGKEDAFTAVAKIFDPLYYPFSDDLVGQPVDDASRADGDYSREAAAYEHLRKKGLTGSFAPEYYGSWTFTLSIRDHTGGVQQRQIRLILIEHLNGYSMRSLFTRNSSGPDAEVDAFHYGEDFRLDVLATLLDGEVRQVHSGLSQGDLAPRNIVIVPHSGNELNPQQGPRPRVVLVDYALALVWAQTKYSKVMGESASAVLPQNPMERYWTASFIHLAGWVPEAWHSNLRLRQEWLVSRFGAETKSNYAPISEDHHQSATEHPSGSDAGQAPQQQSAPRQPNASGAGQEHHKQPVTKLDDASGAGQGASQRPAIQGSSTTAGDISTFEFEVAPPPEIWPGYRNSPTFKIFTG